MQIVIDAPIFEASKLEQQMKENTINTKEYKSIIVKHIDSVINQEEFLNNLKQNRIIATSSQILQRFKNFFPIAIEIPPLNQRKEDLKELINYYKLESMKLFGIEDRFNDIDIQYSQNDISIKQAVYKQVSLYATTQQNDISFILENFFEKQLQDGANYKTLLEIFDTAVLKASKTMFKSQMQMATKLQISRITLRKKIDLLKLDQTKG